MQSTIKQILSTKAINLSRSTKRILAIFLDLLFCVFATWLALSFHFDQLIIFNWKHTLPILISVGIAIPIFYIFGFYRFIFRYSTSYNLQILAKSITAYTLIYSMIFLLLEMESIPQSIGLMQPMILFILISTSRWLIKIWLNQYIKATLTTKAKKEVIIYGAGDSGRQLASNINNSNEFKLLFFIDNNKSFWGGTINGYSVKSPSSINNLTSLGKPTELWLAMPKLSAHQRGKLINNLHKLRLHVRTLPSFSDLTNRRVHLSDVRELDINELVGRESIKPNTNLLKKCIFNKTVLVTGAGGSIGSEICRQILANKPKYILLADNSEVALYNIHAEL